MSLDPGKPPRDFDPAKLPLPKNQGFPFQKDLSYSLEIGAGAGLHAILQAKEFPHCIHIALERTHQKFGSFQSRIQSHQLPNLFGFQDDAINWLSHNAKFPCLEKIFIPYPNPNLKNPAQRWCRMPFNHCLIASLKIGGELILSTNIQEYAEEARDYYSQYWKLQLLEHKCIQQKSDPNFKPRTHFEKKYFLGGEELHKLRFQKQTDSFWNFSF